MKRGHIYIYTHIDGHRDSMKESAKGRFFENAQGRFKGGGSALVGLSSLRGL